MYKQICFGEENVRNFLEEQGVLYEHQDTNKLPKGLWEKFILSDEDKAKILEIFDADIRSLAEKHGYKNWDIIALSDATPNLDVISVPVNTPHFFTLMENRRVLAVRLFIDATGWVAHPFEDPEF